MAIKTVRLQLNGTWHSLTYNGSGQWEAQITAPGMTSFNQPGGYYPVVLEAMNEAGTIQTVTTSDADIGAALKLVVHETVKPMVVITAPSEGAYLDESSPDVAFQLRDEPGGSGIDLGSLSVTLDGAAISDVSAEPVTNGYDCSFTASTLTDGIHTLTVTIADNDGNVSTAASCSFTVDTTPPVLDISSPVQNYITNEPSQTVSGTTNDATSPDVTVAITLNSANLGTISVAGDGSFTKTVTLAEGANTIVVTATDTAGRVSTVTRNVVLDTTVPQFESITFTPNPADTGATLIITAVVR